MSMGHVSIFCTIKMHACIARLQDVLAAIVLSLRNLEIGYQSWMQNRSKEILRRGYRYRYLSIYLYIQSLTVSYYPSTKHDKYATFDVDLDENLSLSTSTSSYATFGPRALLVSASGLGQRSSYFRLRAKCGHGAPNLTGQGRCCGCIRLDDNHVAGTGPTRIMISIYIYRYIDISIDKIDIDRYIYR
jgi:hypothetical protein